MASLFSSSSQFPQIFSTRVFIISLLILVMTIEQHITLASTSSSTSEDNIAKLGHLVGHLLIGSLSQCFLFLGTAHNTEFDLSPLIHHLSLTTTTPNLYVTLTNSSGSDGESFKTFTTERNVDHHHRRSHSHCSLVLGFLTESERETNYFYSQIVTGFPDLVQKDQDFFLLVGKNVAIIEKALASESLGKRIKHRVGLALETFEGRGACSYCEMKPFPLRMEDHGINFDRVLAKALLFNPTRNLEGGVLYVSTPLSTRWLNEMVQSPTSGSWIVKRGTYKLVLNLLESTLNFSSVHFPSTGGGTGAFVNGSTWIGTVGDVLYGRADLGHVTAETWARSQVVANSFPISNERLTFFTGVPQPYYSWSAVYRPLANEVWPFVGLALSVGLVMFFILVKIHRAGTGGKDGWTIVMLGEYVVGTLLEHDPISPAKMLKTASGALRTFTIFWLLFTMLISTAYRSKLVTFLAFPNVENAPDSFEALAESNYKIGLKYIKGAAYAVFKTSKNPTYAKIFQRMSLVSDEVNCFLSAADVKSHFACISWDSIAEFVKHRNLTDKYGQSPIVKSPSSTLNANAGLVMEKRAVFKAQFDDILRWITDTGILIKIRALDIQYIRIQRSEWLRSTGGQRSVYHSTHAGSNALSLQHFRASFYTFGVCIILAGICFLCELCSVCKTERRKTECNHFRNSRNVIPCQVMVKNVLPITKRI